MEIREEHSFEKPFNQLALANTIYTTLVGFVSGPDGRGTLSLLFSCIFTLVLCVWSTVHLNLPKPTESSLEHTWRYLKWSLLGIFGPEFVIWTAWRQHISARALANNIKALQGSLPEDRIPTDQVITRKQWTMVHSFYAGMSGFVIDTNTPDMTDGPAFIPGWTRLYLTPRAIMLLTECGLLPNITRDEIIDKSKSDSAQKIICCLQAGWMVVQAITRLAVGIPVTQLEINTIGHVIWALAIFILWWDKPGIVKQPTRLEGEWNIFHDFRGKPEISRLLRIPSTSGPQSRDKSPVEALEVEVTDDSTHPRSGAFIPRPHEHASTRPHDLAEIESDCASVDTALAEMQKTRRKLACEATEHYPATRRRFRWQESGVESRYEEALRLYPEMSDRIKAKIARKVPTYKPSGLDLAAAAAVAAPQEYRAEEFVLEHPRDWPADDLLRGVSGLFVGTTLWLLSMGFGAIHVSGWNAEFPSGVEAWLWHASSLYVMSSCLLLSLINVLAHVSASVWWFWYDALAGEAHWATRAALVTLCSVGGSAYIVARMYLVVEAFASLRDLPFGAFVSPSWVLTVPHL